MNINFAWTLFNMLIYGIKQSLTIQCSDVQSLYQNNVTTKMDPSNFHSTFSVFLRSFMFIFTLAIRARTMLKWVRNAIKFMGVTFAPTLLLHLKVHYTQKVENVHVLQISQLIVVASGSMTQE